ncbi:MAG TPA: FG-GAP-like repeat-containing protein, partial [Terracidiphilus sp.]|nr:FG-GAP-like repeat-containing protein [Terracidiphilus sp.]
MRRAFIGGFLLVAFQAAAPAQTSTSTTLAVTSEGGAVTTVSSGSAVTLTATVTAGATPVTVGQVSFCDATAQSCADIHLLGMAKLRGAGTATLKFLPPIGSHSYKAIFAGAPNSALHAAASSSSGAALTVTGLSPTETTITQSGFAGNYTVTATVGGVGGTAPTGTVSILNASDGNAGLGSAALSAGTAELNFLNSSSLSLASDSTPVAVGDFNGDGLPDIAIATAALSNSVTVCLSDGHGNFTPAPAVNLGTVFVDSLATGDFNGDGVLDLAVGSSVAGTITTLLGNGDGTFKVMGSASTGGAFPSFVVGDFNGDGIPDLGVLNTTAETVTLLLGSGDGTFSPSTASASATSTDPLLITAGDFNGDGVLDLAILNGAPTGDVGTVTVLLGNGDGTFAATAVSPSAGGETPASIVVADFNGDGILDLAIADGPPNDDLQATATILLGSGDGTFITSSASPVVISQGIASLADHLAVGDFNGDGKADLIVEDEDIGASILMLGNGDGTFRFAQGTVSNADGFPIYVAVGDFNGDGWTDLVGEGKVLFAVDETSTATATG